jgi:putative membrane protein
MPSFILVLVDGIHFTTGLFIAPIMLMNVDYLAYTNTAFSIHCAQGFLMIPKYTDHSANERTYLAWIRTAISIMAFGFLIEKFDLFIEYISTVSNGSVSITPSILTTVIGLGLFLVGVIVILAATLRFFSYKKAIEAEEHFPYAVKRANLLLSSLMIVVALFSLGYIASQLL